jgi:hypothetical protein
MSKYPDLQKVEDEICAVARQIVRENRVKDSCHDKCVSCLVAQARGERDRQVYDGGFNSTEDAAMIGAKSTLLAEDEFAGWLDR